MRRLTLPLSQLNANARKIVLQRRVKKEWLGPD
jgi:hypothetical protein